MSEMIMSGSQYVTFAVRITLALSLVLALFFPLYQNKVDRLGGGISFWKSIWLVYAIVLWLVLPCFFAVYDSWWLLLAGSMFLRVLVELPLCATKKWRVSYGVFHDIVHLGLVVFVMTRMSSEGIIWLGLTLVSLLTELVFVYCFRRTGGNPEEGVYFVPPEKKFRWLNWLTACCLIPQLAVVGTMMY